MKTISMGVAAALVLLLGWGVSPARAQCASKPSAKPAISGTYIDNFGGVQVISDSFWVSGSFVFEICSVDNANKNIIAYNNQGNSYNTGKFSRFDWFTDKNRLWYCQQVFDATSEQAAASASAPDTHDVRIGGCGVPANNFEWTSLVKILP